MAPTGTDQQVAATSTGVSGAFYNGRGVAVRHNLSELITDL